MDKQSVVITGVKLSLWDATVLIATVAVATIPAAVLVALFTALVIHLGRLVLGV